VARRMDFQRGVMSAPVERPRQGHTHQEQASGRQAA